MPIDRLDPLLGMLESVHLLAWQRIRRSDRYVEHVVPMRLLSLAMEAPVGQLEAGGMLPRRGGPKPNARGSDKDPVRVRWGNASRFIDMPVESRRPLGSAPSSHGFSTLTGAIIHLVMMQMAETLSSETP